MVFLISWLILFPTDSANAQNVAEMLQNSLTAHEKSSTYAEWGGSPYHPHNLFEKYQTLEEKKKFATSLCPELQKLSFSDLNLFYEELSQWTLKNEIPCLALVLKKTKVYYDIRSTQLMLDHFIKNLKLESYQEGLSKTLGPSRIELVETTGGPVFWYGDRGGLAEKEIALTFDDGPHPTLTPQLLDILKEENVQATFFTVGKNVDKYGDVVQSLLDDGHSLGTHSYSHRNLPKLKSSTAYHDINSGFDSALLQVGIVAPFFRFPFGSKNKNLTDFVKTSDFASFFWDVDTLDWKKKDPKKLLDYSLQQIIKMDRSIVLFHDIQPQTIAMMPTLLKELKVRGYKMVVYEPTEWLIHKTP